MEQMDQKTRRLTRSIMRRRSVADNWEEICSDDQLVATENIQTPLKRSLRQPKVSQSETKFKRKSRNSLQSTCGDLRRFAVEVLAEQSITPQQLPTRNTKVFQKCFVNLESLTPGKLSLVKTVTSPLVKIKDEIANRKRNKVEIVEMENKFMRNIGSTKQEEGINEEEDRDEEAVTPKDIEDLADIGESVLNDTFTILSDDESISKTETTTSNMNVHDTSALLQNTMKKEISIGNINVTKRDNIYDTPIPLQNLTIQKTSIGNINCTKEENICDILPIHSPFGIIGNKSENVNFDETAGPQRKRLSVSQKASKFLKSIKPEKILGSSKIMRKSRLSSVGVPRIPKISGTKAIHLYEFLTDERCSRNLESSALETKENELPPSCSSTPKILKNHVMKSLLKSSLPKSSVTFADTTNINCDSMLKGKNVKVSRGKLPNFAVLHKKQFDKMENISDYQHRKSERAKLLLSGSKPRKDISNITTPKTLAITKELMPSVNTISKKSEETESDDDDISEIGCRPLLTDTILQEKHLKSAMWKEKAKGLNETGQYQGQNKGKKVTMLVSPDKPLNFTPSGFAVRKTPFRENPDEMKSPLKLKKTNLFSDFGKATKTSDLNLKSTKNHFISNGKIRDKQSSNNDKIGVQKIFKGNSNTVAKGALSKPTINKPSTTRSAVTRFGFKVPVKNKKDDIVKSVVNKTRLPAGDSTTNINENRAIIKGVRSNRRFDLLMKMRSNNK